MVKNNTTIAARRIRFTLGHPAPAVEHVAGVENGRLPRRHGAQVCGVMGPDLDGSIPFGRHVAGGGAAPVPHLHLQICGFGGNRPAHVAGPEYLAREGFPLAHDDGGRTRFQFHHVARRTAPQIEAPPLPHGEVGHPPVPAEHVPLQIHDVARPVDAGFFRSQESAVIILRHEANLLAFGLLRGGEAQFPGVFPRSLLRELAQGERGARELGLRHAEEEIGLVLLPIKTPGDAQAPVDLHPPGVMARDERLRAERHRALGQVVELHGLVALDAGHGRSAALVF